ncbi:MAG: hypothetical protein FWC32_00990 [Firmicutes bacterium]|nr:hypothetical protein [Bacillota bacterium]
MVLLKTLWQKKKTPIVFGLVLLAALAVGAIADNSSTEPCEPTPHMEAAYVPEPALFRGQHALDVPYPCVARALL